MNQRIKEQITNWVGRWGSRWVENKIENIVSKNDDEIVKDSYCTAFQNQQEPVKSTRTSEPNKKKTTRNNVQPCQLRSI